MLTHRNTAKALRQRQQMVPPEPIPGAVWIPLSGGQHFALVDEADAPEVNRFVWSVAKRTRITFAYRSNGVDGAYRSLYLQKYLWELWGLPTARIGALNKNGLDLRRENWRAITPAQSSAYRSIANTGANQSGYRGVSKCPTTGLWRAAITVRGKFYHLGRFERIEDAANAYDKAARRAHGRYAFINIRSPAPANDVGGRDDRAS